MILRGDLFEQAIGAKREYIFKEESNLELGEIAGAAR